MKNCHSTLKNSKLLRITYYSRDVTLMKIFYDSRVVGFFVCAKKCIKQDTAKTTLIFR